MQKVVTIVRKSIADLRRMSFLEALTTVVAAVEPLSSIPQVHLVYSTKSAEDLALITSYFGVAAGVIWLAYGIQVRNIPILVSASMWLIVEILILIAILLYG